MDNIIYSEDLFESIPDYRKIVLIMFFFKKDIDCLRECGFLKSVIKRPSLVFRKILLEQNEEFYS